jgi:hypothetical protein
VQEEGEAVYEEKSDVVLGFGEEIGDGVGEKEG